MQKVSPVKVRVTSQPPSPAGSTLAFPQASLLADALLLSQSLTSSWKSEQKLRTGSPLCPALQQARPSPLLLPTIIGSKRRKMTLCLPCECY